MSPLSVVHISVQAFQAISIQKMILCLFQFWRILCEVFRWMDVNSPYPIRTKESSFKKTNVRLTKTLIVHSKWPAHSTNSHTGTTTNCHPTMISSSKPSAGMNSLKLYVFHIQHFTALLVKWFEIIFLCFLLQLHTPVTPDEYEAEQSKQWFVISSLISVERLLSILNQCHSCWIKYKIQNWNKKIQKNTIRFQFYWFIWNVKIVCGSDLKYLKKKTQKNSSCHSDLACILWRWSEYADHNSMVSFVRFECDLFLRFQFVSL